MDPTLRAILDDLANTRVLLGVARERIVALEAELAAAMEELKTP